MMRRYSLTAWGLENLKLEAVAAAAPQAGEVAIDMRALSLNYRDLLLVRGQYNPKQPLPAVPIGDGAGVISAVGPGVSHVRVGDRVVTNYISDWIDGAFRLDYRKSTLGTPGPGLAAERVVLPERAVLPLPDELEFAAAATLPIAGLTAWSCLVTESSLTRGQTLLTLGTGGVSVFALQIAKALGLRVIITSSSDAKLARAKAIGADATINYRRNPDWERTVLELTGGAGADVTIETGGAETLNRSLKATRGGGTVMVLGSIAGLEGTLAVNQIFMRRIRVQGIFVDSRAALEQFIVFVRRENLKPVIDRHFPFDELPAALQHLASAAHFGKIVIDVP